MSTATIGKKIPAFSLSATSEKDITIASMKGLNVVIFFYPKDNTPGCTTESQGFRDAFADFEKTNTIIFGVSRDSLRSHENFKKKHAMPFDLISDPDEVLCKIFDVIKLKKLYGKEYMGIERSTFLIDSKGLLKQEWRKVKVIGHVEEVLSAAQEL